MCLAVRAPRSQECSYPSIKGDTIALHVRQYLCCCFFSTNMMGMDGLPMCKLLANKEIHNHNQDHLVFFRF